MNVKRHAVVMLGCAVTALCLPSSALAAGDWLPAQKLTDADMGGPKVGVFADGEAIAVWGPAAPFAPGASPGGAEASIRPAGGSFGAPQQLSAEGAVQPLLALNAAGSAAVAWYSESAQHVALRVPGGEFGELAQMDSFALDIAVDGAGYVHALIGQYEYASPGDRTVRLAVATLPPDGGPATVRPVAQQADILGPSMAADAAGTVTVAWRGVRDGETSAQSHVFVATAGPGASFGEPTPVSPAYYDDNSSGQATRIATNARGDVLVFWPGADRPNPYGTGIRQEQVLRGAFRPAGGEFRPEEKVPVPVENARGVYRWDAAMAADGGAVVAWSNAVTVAMTYRPAAGPFEEAYRPAPFPVCCSGEFLSESDPAVAFDGDGNAAVAYTSATPHGTRLLVSRRPLNGAFEPPQSAYAAPHAFAPDIAFDSGGRGVLVWSPQELMSTEASRNDHGIYAAEYDPDAPPRLTRIVVRSKPRLGLEATDQGRATLVVRQRVRGRLKRVLLKHPKVVPGYNAVQLTRRQQGRLARRSRYVATATLTDKGGRTSTPIRTSFRGRR